MVRYISNQVLQCIRKEYIKHSTDYLPYVGYCHTKSGSRYPCIPCVIGMVNGFSFKKLTSGKKQKPMKVSSSEIDSRK